MNPIEYHGVQSIRLQQNITVPNLYTIASNLMFQPMIECPPQYSEPSIPQPSFNPYQLICRYVENTPSVRKTPPKRHECSINMAEKVGDLFTFRNNNLQGSKLTFFDGDSPTRIFFYRVEAAAFMNSNHRLCMVAIKNGVQKIMVVERFEDQLDILCEHDLNLGFHCVDIKYVRSEYGKEYLVVFAGFQNKPQSIIVFLFEKGISFILKKNANYVEGRLFPLIYQTVHNENGWDNTYFYMIGGRKQVTGNQECHLNYQYFSLDSLYSAESSLKSVIEELSYNERVKMKNKLFNGAINKKYFVIPDSNQIFVIVQKHDFKIELQNSGFQLQQQQGKHRRYLECQLSINQIDDQTIQYRHVCCDQKRFVKKQELTKRREKTCKLI